MAAVRGAQRGSRRALARGAAVRRCGGAAVRRCGGAARELMASAMAAMRAQRARKHTQRRRGGQQRKEEDGARASAAPAQHAGGVHLTARCRSGLVARAALPAAARCVRVEAPPRPAHASPRSRLPAPAPARCPARRGRPDAARRAWLRPRGGRVVLGAAPGRVRRALFSAGRSAARQSRARVHRLPSGPAAGGAVRCDVGYAAHALRVRRPRLPLALAVDLTPSGCCSYARDKPRFADNLDVIKFLCKEFWSEVFKKQVDNLKTNYRVRRTLAPLRFLSSRLSLVLVPGRVCADRHALPLAVALRGRLRPRRVRGGGARAPRALRHPGGRAGGPRRRGCRHS
jgi:hypothetical protein